MSVLVLLLLLAPVAQSLGGYIWLAVSVSRQGGRVRPDALGLPDLMVCTVLSLALIQIAVLSYSKGATAEQVKSLSPVMIFSGSILLLTICSGVAGFLVFRRISLRELFGWQRIPWWQIALWASGLLLLALPSVAVAMRAAADLLPKSASDEQLIVGIFRSEIREGHFTKVACVAIASVVLAPLLEEFLFRGYFYPVGKRYFGAAPSAVLTSVLFALVHANVLSFAALFVLALGLTVAYERTGSIVVPMLMHAGFNALMLLLMAVEVLRTVTP